MSTSKYLSKKSLGTVSLAGVLLLLGGTGLAILRSPSQVSSLPKAVAPITVQQKVNYGLPVRLKIPAISLDTAIEAVGITNKGEMGTPEDPANVAWFNLGPRPGEVGNSVIDGHLDWYNGAVTAFENLSKLQKGDKLYVVDETGAATTFVVRGFGTFDQNQDATSVFRSVDGKAHLNLITCEGVWNEAQQSYSSRLIVFTNKEI